MDYKSKYYKYKQKYMELKNKKSDIIDETFNSKKQSNNYEYKITQNISSSN